MTQMHFCFLSSVACLLYVIVIFYSRCCVMKFPYGIADFYKIVEGNYFYQDRTDRISFIENIGSQLLFLRPRRFGKSLLLSMLENYYDIAKADDFEKLFGKLAIGNNPTSRHNQYFVLRWDFSCIKAQGEIHEIEAAIHRYINERIQAFIRDYQDYLPAEITAYQGDAIASFDALLNGIKQTNIKLYLLIDEYDNFANEVMMARKPHYEALLYGEGLLKTVFKAVKSAASGQGLDRVFITGVSPIVMSDLTSGYNVAKNIYLMKEFNDLCGFHEAEIHKLLDGMAANCQFSEGKLQEIKSLMKTLYNGYSFSHAADALVYNPTLSLYFLEEIQRECEYPRKLLDSNLAMDRNKLVYISKLDHGQKILADALNPEITLSIAELADRFGVEDLLTVRKDSVFMVSLLYYFGVLTLAGENEFGELAFEIPNLVVHKLYAERLQELFLPEYEDKEEIRRIGQCFYQQADIQPACDFIGQRYFKILSNRDYLKSDEFSLKLAFLTILFNDTFYIMESESERQRRYSDLSFILRPDKRKFKLHDLLIEFKFIKLGELGLKGEQLNQSTIDELKRLSIVEDNFIEARQQLETYRKTLSEKYGELRLTSFVVISLGFDRLLWWEV